MSQCNGRRYLADSFITANGVTHPRDTFKKKDSSTNVKDCRQLRYTTSNGFVENYDHLLKIFVQVYYKNKVATSSTNNTCNSSVSASSGAILIPPFPRPSL